VDAQWAAGELWAKQKRERAIMSWPRSRYWASARPTRRVRFLSQNLSYLAHRFQYPGFIMKLTSMFATYQYI
jgi:hypothetical protein